jgi:protein TonB
MPKIEPKPAPVHKEEKPSSVSVPVVPPFKGFIEEKEKLKARKKSSGKFVRIAAGALVIIAVVSFVAIKKKETLTFFKQPSNRVAALQTIGSPDEAVGNPGQPVPHPSEEDLQKEIQEQIAAYRSQKARIENNSNRAPASNGKGSGLAGPPTSRVESAPAPVVLPKETPQLDVNLNASRKPEQAKVVEPGTTTAEKTESEERPGQAAENKPEDQPAITQVQKANPGDLVPLSMVDVEPKVIKTVGPVYPETDRRLGIKGNITLNVLISENGDVLDAAVLKGVKGSVALEREAISAVKKWKFLPAEKDGVKVKVWKPITIGFGTK